MAGPVIAHIADAQKQSTSPIDFNQMLEEFQLMLRYVLGEGLTLDDNTRITVAAIPSTPAATDLVKLMAAHGALVKIIAPATPLSLRATEPAPGPLGSMRRPPLIMTMIALAIIFVVG